MFSMSKSMGGTVVSRACWISESPCFRRNLKRLVIELGATKARLVDLWELTLCELSRELGFKDLDSSHETTAASKKAFLRRWCNLWYQVKRWKRMNLNTRKAQLKTNGHVPNLPRLAHLGMQASVVPLHPFAQQGQ